MQKNKPFITGTSVYGPFDKENSDIDIVMTYFDSEVLLEKIKLAGFEVELAQERNTNYMGFKFEIAGRQFQVIAVTPGVEYESWLYATGMMLNLEAMHDREKRIQLFTDFKKKYMKKNF